MRIDENGCTEVGSLSGFGNKSVLADANAVEAVTSSTKGTDCAHKENEAVQSICIPS